MRKDVVIAFAVNSLSATSAFTVAPELALLSDLWRRARDFAVWIGSWTDPCLLWFSPLEVEQLSVWLMGTMSLVAKLVPGIGFQLGMVVQLVGESSDEK